MAQSAVVRDYRALESGRRRAKRRELTVAGCGPSSVELYPDATRKSKRERWSQNARTGRIPIAALHSLARALRVRPGRGPRAPEDRGGESLKLWTWWRIIASADRGEKPAP